MATIDVTANYVVALGDTVSSVGPTNVPYPPLFVMDGNISRPDPTIPNDGTISDQGLADGSFATVGIQYNGGVSYQNSVFTNAASGVFLVTAVTNAQGIASGSTTGSLFNNGLFQVSSSGTALGADVSGDVTFNNAGTFSVDGVSAVGVGSIAGAHYINSGQFTVTGTGSGAYGFNFAVTSWADFDNSGTITVSDGLDQLQDIAVQFTGSSAAPLVLHNSGTITAVQAFLEVASHGLGAPDILNNSGTINGSIDLGEAHDEVHNTGTINGAVMLGDGADLYDGATGHLGGGILYGGAGDDTVTAGAGNDILDGGGGQDTVSYATATSAVYVSLAVQGGQDTLGAGDDTLIRFENLTGSGFDDVLTGDDGPNLISGGLGSDTIDGGADTPSAFASTGPNNDTLDGGAGVDTVSYASADSSVVVTLAAVGGQETRGAGIDTLIRFENLAGSNFDDILTGDGSSNIISGGVGADTIDGGGGGDILDGGPGMDTASFASAAAPVIVTLAAGGGQETGGAGNVTLIRFENLAGSAFDDNLTGDANDNIIIGGAGNDTIIGGGTGADTISGGGGRDILDGGAGVDTASFALAGAPVIVTLAASGGQETGGAGNVTLIRFENLTGSAFDDNLTGDANSNILSAGAGADTLDGGGGNDILDGGPGSDTASYASAGSAVRVSLAVQGGQDTLGAGNDTLIRMENLSGSSFDDTLSGDATANVLTGGLGADTLTGGGGNDSFVFTGLADSTTASPDLITDFATGSLIDLSAIDADTTTGGDQAFHLGGGGGHAGDIVVSYNAGTNQTTLDLYVDNNGSVDARTLMVGDHSSIAAGDFIL